MKKWAAIRKRVVILGEMEANPNILYLTMSEPFKMCATFYHLCWIWGSKQLIHSIQQASSIGSTKIALLPASLPGDESIRRI